MSQADSAQGWALEFTDGTVDHYTTEDSLDAHIALYGSGGGGKTIARICYLDPTGVAVWGDVIFPPEPV